MVKFNGRRHGTSEQPLFCQQGSPIPHLCASSGVGVVSDAASTVCQGQPFFPPIGSYRPLSNPIPLPPPLPPPLPCSSTSQNHLEEVGILHAHHGDVRRRAKSPFRVQLSAIASKASALLGALPSRKFLLFCTPHTSQIHVVEVDILHA